MRDELKLSNTETLKLQLEKDKVVINELIY